MKAASASKQPQRPRKKAKTKLFPQLVANRPSMCDLSDSSVQNIHSTTQCGIYKIKKIVKTFLFSHHHLEHPFELTLNKIMQKNEAILNSLIFHFVKGPSKFDFEIKTFNFSI